MRGLLYVLTAFAVVGLGFWAYHENYQTQESLRKLRKLNAEIGTAHSRINMLRAEWAYLNRPDRLRDLADLNFDRLGLLPLAPEGFGRVDQIVYAIPDLLPILNTVEASSDGATPTEDEPL